MFFHHSEYSESEYLESQYPGKPTATVAVLQKLIDV